LFAAGGLQIGCIGRALGAAGQGSGRDGKNGCTSTGADDTAKGAAAASCELKQEKNETTKGNQGHATLRHRIESPEMEFGTMLSCSELDANVV
jgi:hypothetical protein